MAMLNAYEARQEERRERLEAFAERARQEAQARFGAVDSTLRMIPLGQPVLVGHHSEARHRRDLSRMDSNTQKGIEASQRADEFERRADAVGRGGISSDDPGAVEKLREELAKHERTQERMKLANTIVRSKASDEQKIARLCVEAGMKPEQAAALLRPDFCGRLGFAPYALTNNSANIRRIQQRIAELEARATAQAAPPVEGNGYTITEDTADNRILIEFDAKPSEEVRESLKRHGFKWSPTRGAWCRMLNNAARFAASQIVKKLEA